MFNSVNLPKNVFKKDTPIQLFYCKFYEIFKNIYFVGHLKMSASVHLRLEIITLIQWHNSYAKRRELDPRATLQTSHFINCSTLVEDLGFSSKILFYPPGATMSA